jgi:hypothetical protein
VKTIYNTFMLRRSFFRLSIVLAGLALVCLSLPASAQQRGRKFKSPPPTARVQVTVVRDASGKPIENASVIFHPVEGDKNRGDMELKTRDDGTAMIDLLPVGSTVRLQIIAKGFQTYGRDYKIDQADLAFEVRMKRPGEQYSIYNDHPPATDADKTPKTPPAKDDAPAAQSAAPSSEATPPSQDQPPMK